MKTTKLNTTKLASASTLNDILGMIKKFWFREDIELIPSEESKNLYRVKLGETIQPCAFVEVKNKRFYFITRY